MKKTFLHIPKTAGTSVSNLPNINHICHYKLDPHTSYDFVFTIVRNPFERFQSAFYHHMTLDSPDHYYKDVDTYSNLRLHYSDINSFVLGIINNEKNAINAFNYIHFKPQTDFLLNKNGIIDPRINLIIKYEDLHSHFPELKSFILNKTPSFNKTPMNQNTINFIKNFYKLDFDLLGY